MIQETLTVKELIDLLQKLDGKLPVYYMNDEFNCTMQLTSAPVVKCDLAKWASNVGKYNPTKCSSNTKAVVLGYEE